MIDLAATQRTTLTIDEVCAIFTKTRRSVYYWIEHRKLVIARPGHVTVDSVRTLALDKLGYLPRPSSVPAHSVQSSAKSA